jgi:hypothetical protein
MVEHVRAELRTKFPGMAQDYLQWDSVMTNWDGVRTLIFEYVSNNIANYRLAVA